MPNKILNNGLWLRLLPFVITAVLSVGIVYATMREQLTRAAAQATLNAGQINALENQLATMNLYIVDTRENTKDISSLKEMIIRLDEKTTFIKLSVERIEKNLEK